MSHDDSTNQAVVDEISESEKSMVELEDILMDETKVNAAMKTIAAQEISERMEASLAALTEEKATDFDELD